MLNLGISGVIGVVEDLILAVDVSSSMSARDFKPTRMGAVREAMKAFIRKKLIVDPVARIGIVAFYEYSLPVIDLTGDVKALINAVNSLRPLGRGTALGDGIVEAYCMFKDLSRDGVCKRILVVTDGTFNAGIDPRCAILPLKLHGVRVDFFTFSRLYPSDVSTIREILKTIKGRFVNVKSGDLVKAIMEFL